MCRIVNQLFALVGICIVALPLFEDNSLADRKIRIHFVAASFSFAKDEAQNSELSVFSSKAGFDAVWEASVPSGLPTAYGTAKRVSGSGQTSSRTKSGLEDCDGTLSYSDESRWPGVSVYNINGNKFALEIVAPDASLLSSSQSPRVTAPSSSLMQTGRA